MSRISLAALAVLAVGSTAGATACLAILSSHASSLPTVQATAIASAALQGTLLIVLSWFISSHALVRIRELSKPFSGVAFGLGVLASLVSFAAGIVTLVWLAHATTDNNDIRSNRSSMITSVAVMLAIAVTSQIAFMLIHLAQSHQRMLSLRQHFASKEASPWSAAAHLKSIRYSQTMPRTSDSEESISIGLEDTPPSLRNKLMQAAPLKLAFPQPIRHTSSRTRLLAAKDSFQSISAASNPHPSSTQESFDNWDTSSVDLRNRQVVMEVSTSPTTTRNYALETIPGSPRASLNAGNILDIAPPPRRIPQRSRSHSPATIRSVSRGRAPPSPSELHIHPLFRSDSPSTPPILTPGTRVVAAPAGQILAQHRPIHQLPRVRSGSLPSMSRRPFGRQGEPYLAAAASSESLDTLNQERKMTPPVPEWVLNSRVPPIPRKSASRRSLQVTPQ